MSDAQPPDLPENPAPRAASELRTRVVSAVVLGIAAITAAWIGGTVFLAFWAAAALAVWWEWTAVIKAAPRPLLAGIGAVALLGMAAALAADVAAVAFVCAIVGAGVAMAGVQTGRAWAAAGVLYAAAVVIPIVVLRGDAEAGLVAVLWLFAVVWAEDSGAYFAGRYFGGPKLAPAISPKKTWSGAAGGTIAGIAAGTAVLLVAGIALLPAHFVIALVVVVAAQLGDLLESGIKRRFSVKDSGQLVPGHGGLMDRLDGFLFAAAVALAIGLAMGGSRPAAGLLLW